MPASQAIVDVLWAHMVPSSRQTTDAEPGGEGGGEPERTGLPDRLGP